MNIYKNFTHFLGPFTRAKLEQVINLWPLFLFFWPLFINSSDYLPRFIIIYN